VYQHVFLFKKNKKQKVVKKYTIKAYSIIHFNDNYVYELKEK